MGPEAQNAPSGNRRASLSSTAAWRVWPAGRSVRFAARNGARLICGARWRNRSNRSQESKSFGPCAGTTRPDIPSACCIFLRRPSASADLASAARNHSLVRMLCPEDREIAFQRTSLRFGAVYPRIFNSLYFLKSKFGNSSPPHKSTQSSLCSQVTLNKANLYRDSVESETSFQGNLQPDSKLASE